MDDRFAKPKCNCCGEELKNQIIDLYKPREEKYKNGVKTNNND